MPVPVPVPVPDGKQTSPCIDCALRTQPHLCGALFGDKEQGTLNRRWSSLSQHHKVARSRRTIYRSNEPTNSIAIICQGWACLYLLLPDGSRQIISFLLPGDIVSATAVFQDRSGFSVEAITDLHYSVLNKAEFRALLSADKRSFDEFAKTWVGRKEEVENLAADGGHRSAEQRIARLFWGLLERNRALDMVYDNRFAFPLRLHHIADATGLTIVHVSRVISLMSKLVS